MENIAVHAASTYGGAQFYLSCGQVEITGGGNGTPGPLVSIPGVYTGYVSPHYMQFSKGHINSIFDRNLVFLSILTTPFRRTTLNPVL